MIHPSADVAADARIGQRTSIWNRAQVREGAVVGADCVIGKDAYIDAGVRIGDEVVLIGKQGDRQISADDVAKQLGTSSYEVVSTILARVPRV